MDVDASALQVAEQNEQSNMSPAAGHVEMQHQPFFRKWGGLVVLSLALAIIIIDTTLLNVSLRTIINDLHTNLKSMQWVITIYSLILAAFTITGGRLGDFFGRKRMFIVGAIIFAGGSLLASLSTNIGMVIAGEAIIEGIGAALMMPATSSLLVTNFKGRDRAVAFGVWGGIAAASSAIGPILGGWLTTNYSWRWGFRINIVVVALVLIGSFLIKENHALRQKAKIDFMGIILSSLGLLSVVFGFIQASTFGWFKAKEPLVFLHHTLNLGSLSATPVFIVLGLIILAAFVFWERAYERSGKTPILSLQLFKNNQFVAGASTMAVLALGQAGLFFTIPVFLQAVRHLDALHTGLTLLPLSLALLIAAPLSAFLNKYIKPKLLVQIGLVISVISFIVLRASLSVDSTAWTLAPGFILFGFGMGLIMAQVSNLTLSAVDVKSAGEASGVNNTLRMVGQTLGSAILGAVLLSALVSNVTNGIKDSQVIPSQAKQAIEQSVEDNVSSISFGAQENTSSNVPQAITDEMTKITNQSTVDANKTVMVYGTIFVLLGLLVSTRLPKGSSGEHAGEQPAGSQTPAQLAAAEEDTDSADTAAANLISIDEIPSDEYLISKKTGKILIGMAAVIIVILLLIYGAVLRNDKAKEDAVPTDIVTPPTQTLSPTSNDSDSAPEEAPAPIDQSPLTSSEPVDSQVYSNSALHFSFTEPSDWSIVKDSGGEIVFKSPGALYNVQSFDSPGGDMDSLKSFLESQSNMHNITLSSFGSRSVYSFDIDSSYTTGYAFLEQGRLYYVLGFGSEKTPLVDLKTF